MKQVKLLGVIEILLAAVATIEPDRVGGRGVNGGSDRKLFFGTSSSLAAAAAAEEEGTSCDIGGADGEEDAEETAAESRNSWN